jgi:hypothetical protein
MLSASLRKYGCSSSSGKRRARRRARQPAKPARSRRGSTTSSRIVAPYRWTQRSPPAGEVPPGMCRTESAAIRCPPAKSPAGREQEQHRLEQPGQQGMHLLRRRGRCFPSRPRTGSAGRAHTATARRPGQRRRPTGGRCGRRARVSGSLSTAHSLMKFAEAGRHGGRQLARHAPALPTLRRRNRPCPAQPVLRPGSGPRPAG